MALVYLNNFPSQNAVKGQEFKGDSNLEKQLLQRGIIGDGKKTVETIDTAAKDAEILALQETVAAKDTEIEELIALVEEASQLPKGQTPDGFSKYKGE